MKKIERFFTSLAPTPISYLCTINNKRLYLKKDYLNHKTIQGNKLRKLKYTLLAAQSKGQTLLSFGGAYSNHIAALAAAGSEFQIPTVGIIRGEELADVNRWGRTLEIAAKQGMKLHFVSRQAYRSKHNDSHIKSIIQQYANAFIVPEGGSNKESVRGSMEIMAELAANSERFHTIFAATGTGGTLAGLIDGAAAEKLSCQVIGIPVLQDTDNILQTIFRLSKSFQRVDWQLNSDYHFGGYAKKNLELENFSSDFEQRFDIPLDLVYTAKLAYAVFDLAANSTNNDSEDWLIYHSGGLQGRTS